MPFDTKSKNAEYNRVDIDGGKITDPVEIAKYKNTQRIDVIENYLLGDFNKSGGYVLAEDLMEELISIPKVLRYNYNKTNFASSLEIEGFGKIEFAIKVYVDTPIKGDATAALTLLEPINKVNGYYQNTNSVVLALYKGKADKEFISNVFESFNLRTDDDDDDDDNGGKKIKDIQDVKDIPTIIARKKYLLSVKDKLTKGLSEVEKDYYTSRMALLKKDPAVGLAILEEVALQEAKIKDLFLQGEGSGNIYKDLNELLDSVIENNTDDMAKLAPEIKEALIKKGEEFIEKTEAIIDESKNAVVKKAKKQDKQTVKQEALKQELNEKKEETKKPINTDTKAQVSKPKSSSNSSSSSKLSKTVINNTDYSETNSSNDSINSENASQEGQQEEKAKKLREDSKKREQEEKAKKLREDSKRRQQEEKAKKLREDSKKRGQEKQTEEEAYVE